MGLKECGLNLSRDNKELKPHGTIDFPCAGYSRTVCLAAETYLQARTR